MTSFQTSRASIPRETTPSDKARSIRFRMTVWYAGLLAGLLILFGAFAYAGLEHYLHEMMIESLATQAQQIGELLKNVDASGEAYIIDEVEEHLAPESRSRFIRTTRPGGGTLFESGPPKDRGFDPAMKCFMASLSRFRRPCLWS